ncbi:MAG: hypothetical protein JWO57_3401, partial [Pseudonocardiales bacterium]|nr:hypothetical protein [Pseudonocardiales bacterium]
MPVDGSMRLEAGHVLSTTAEPGPVCDGRLGRAEYAKGTVCVGRVPGCRAIGPYTPVLLIQPSADGRVPSAVRT